MGLWGKIKKGLGAAAGIAGTAMLGPVGGALIGYGAKALLNRGGGGAGKRERKNRAAFDASVEAEEGRGTRFSGEYEDRALSYDPQESMNQSVTGMWNIMRPKMQADQVSRRGTVRTGFGAQEEDEYMSNLMASKAMEGERYKFQNMRDIGGYGERARDRSMDARFGVYATEAQQRMTDKASKRQMWGQLGGAAIGAAGRVLASR